MVRLTTSVLALLSGLPIVFWPEPALAQTKGVYVRFRLLAPKDARYYVALGGFIHKSPWYLPNAVIPAGSNRDATKRLPAGTFTPWFDLKDHAGKRLHGRLQRSGGVAEFPNVTARFMTDVKNKTPLSTVEIQLSTAPTDKHVVKRWRESFEGSLTSFLISPDLAKDKDSLETAGEMTARRLAWARAASMGKAVTPQKLIMQTSFWSPQREELNLKEAEVLRLLGFNVVGNQSPAVKQKFAFRIPGHTHAVRFDPGLSRGQVDQSIQRLTKRFKGKLARGVPFNFRDEITAGTIGSSKTALAHFHSWLKKRGVKAEDLGVRKLNQVVPIESPDILRDRQKLNSKAANRIFYYTSRFRQEATTERIRWLTESFHKHIGNGPVTSTLVADHPYFSGTGLGMGMGPNPAWGRAVLAADWFDMARRRAVDVAAIEDWMGLQYMYGPNYTWEGFQLMGFQASMFRSGSRGEMPIIAWITPGDETNLRLKAASALCQGAKHFYFWTYGPTATSTENYWSDIQSAYGGIVNITRQLRKAEHILAPGKTRRTKLALLYSISSDLWQPFGYIHMLERRGTYLSLIHDQYLVDLLTEEDIGLGRLKDYDALYITDPCIKQSAMEKIANWVKSGGYLYGSTAAGSRNEFNEEVPGLAPVFGIAPIVKVRVQPGRYHIRGALNNMAYLDRAKMRAGNKARSEFRLGAIGTRVQVKPNSGTVKAHFQNGNPALVRHSYGKGKTFYVGACPGIAYIKEAKFVPRQLKERWPNEHRQFINQFVKERGVRKLVELSRPIVEAGVYDANDGAALVLANFTYRPIDKLDVQLVTAWPVQSVRSCEKGAVKFTSKKVAAARRPQESAYRVTFSLPLGISDIVVLSKKTNRK